MKHHVKTKAGVTTDYYTHEANNKKFGKGVCKQFMERRVAEAYVDDADCTYVDQKDQANETPTRIQDRLQHIAQ
eukprot:9565902-Ditylum_brightwellii.AAC.1